MIYGIGTDICDLRRVQAVFERRGERFVKAILGEREMMIWRARAARSEMRGTAFLATRFSAKEAFSKALGTGMHAPMRWRDCEILNNPDGRPIIVLNGALRDYCAERGLRAQISLSDERDSVVSFVILEHD